MQEQWLSIVVAGSLSTLFIGWLVTLLVERSSLRHTRLSSYVVIVCVLTTVCTLLLLLFGF